MIHLPNKQKDHPPAQLLSSGACRQIKRAIDNIDGEKYNGTYYKHDDVRKLLRAYSIHKTQMEEGDFAKCNYCESNVEHGVTLQVEHYRPKAKVVSGENDYTELPGYYWLGLEWTNLLLACPKCNGKDAKGNQFPIRGIRAKPVNVISIIDNQPVLDRTHCDAHEAPLCNEEPLLLNPEIDHPEDYLTFDGVGKIIPHGNDVERGQLSIDIYRLNRGSLLPKRIKVWNDFYKRILVDIGGHQSGKLNEVALRFNFGNICKEILKRRLPSEEFTLWGRYINDHLPDLLSTLPGHYVQMFCEEYNLALQEG